MDREKVIKEFELFIKEFHPACTSEGVELDMFREVLSMLKEREPIEPVDDGHGSLICGNQGYECGCVGSYNLKTKVVDKFCNFCPECGRKVKWE